jgi:hypothetical protein
MLDFQNRKPVSVKFLHKEEEKKRELTKGQERKE